MIAHLIATVRTRRALRRRRLWLYAAALSQPAPTRPLYVTRHAGLAAMASRMDCRV